jgi:hypothetical protein
MMAEQKGSLRRNAWENLRWVCNFWTREAAGSKQALVFRQKQWSCDLDSNPSPPSLPQSSQFSQLIPFDLVGTLSKLHVGPFKLILHSLCNM